MTNTPSDPDYINTKALEGFARSLEYALRAKCNFGSTEPYDVDPEALRKLMVEKREQMERLEQQAQAHRASFWYTFPPIKALRSMRDNVRLRKYNEEWIKNNIR